MVALGDIFTAGWQEEEELQQDDKHEDKLQRGTRRNLKCDGQDGEV